MLQEKYDALTPGSSGGGGEYETQTGFGWTNGVALHFLKHYGWNASNSLIGDPAIKPVNLYRTYTDLIAARASAIATAG